MPRDPARIDRVLALLRAYWLAHPDLRLGQIIVNLTPEVQEEVQDDLGVYLAPWRGDPYYVEDDVIEARLREEAK